MGMYLQAKPLEALEDVLSSIKDTLRLTDLMDPDDMEDTIKEVRTLVQDAEAILEDIVNGIETARDALSEL